MTIDPRTRTRSVAALAVTATLSFWLSSGHESVDLLALWLAAGFFGSGPVYPADTSVFTMTVPPVWHEAALAIGHDSGVFPYLYPPLWAALVKPLTAVMTFGTFAAWVLALNYAGIVAMGWLAWRAAGRPGPALPFVTMAVAACCLTQVGHLALITGQLQVAVSLLMILAIERERAGAQTAAGAALAVAAALKVYPALFVVLWLVTGRWRAAASFAVVGGVLAGLSVVLAGWPLHAEFLHLLSTISGTTMLTSLTLSLDPTLLRFGIGGTTELVPSSWVENAEALRIGWLVAEKPAVQALLGKLATLGALVGIGLAMRRAEPDRVYGALWPLAIWAVAILGPITWCHSYLPLFAFLPVLAVRGGTWGRRAALAVTVPLFIPVWALWMTLPVWGSAAQVVGMVCVGLAGAAFARLALGGRAGTAAAGAPVAA